MVSSYKSDDSRTCAKKGGLIALDYYKILELYFTLLIVMTVSFLRFGDYFPGTWDIRDIGYSKGKYYSLNVR